MLRMLLLLAQECGRCDTATDDFFSKHLYSNYGDVGLSVKELVTSLLRPASSTSRCVVVQCCWPAPCHMLRLEQLAITVNVTGLCDVMSRLWRRCAVRDGRLGVVSVCWGGLCTACRALRRLFCGNHNVWCNGGLLGVVCSKLGCQLQQWQWLEVRC